MNIQEFLKGSYNYHQLSETKHFFQKIEISAKK